MHNIRQISWCMQQCVSSINTTHHHIPFLMIWKSYAIIPHMIWSLLPIFFKWVYTWPPWALFLPTESIQPGSYNVQSLFHFSIYLLPSLYIIGGSTYVSAVCTHIAHSSPPLLLSIPSWSWSASHNIQTTSGGFSLCCIQSIPNLKNVSVHVRAHMQQL